MAEEIRRASGTRPAARRRAPARRRPVPRGPAPRRAGWLVPLLTVAAGGLVTAGHLAPTSVEVTATESVVAATPPAAPTPTGAPQVSVLADTAVEGGLAIPQPPRPGGITIMPNAAIGTQPTLVPRPDACGGHTAPRRIPPGVVAGTGTATLEWMADSRPEVLGYRVQAVSQLLVAGVQPLPVLQTVAQVEGCVPVTVTVAGLTSGVPYVFRLEEQVTSASTGVTRLVQVGTTSTVVIG